MSSSCHTPFTLIARPGHPLFILRSLSLQFQVILWSYSGHPHYIIMTSSCHNQVTLTAMSGHPLVILRLPSLSLMASSVYNHINLTVISGHPLVFLRSSLTGTVIGPSYIVGKDMIHGFYPNLISDLQPSISNPLILLIQPWLLASILL